jgi:hypothetical protein
MTALEWDAAGSRRYETGIDRGVLYLQDELETVVPWNGLTGVTENVSREVKSYYTDGVKYLDHHVPGSFSAKLTAFTYPDELETILGIEEFAPGVHIHDQRAQMFHLSYRTKVGNDVDGTDHGYKIHILYNVLAVPDDVAINTLGASVVPQVFSWSLTGTPTNMWGIRPTSHISIHSRSIDPELLVTLEEMLYGSVTADPALLGIVELLELIELALA